MEKKFIRDTNLQLAKELMGHTGFIEDDIVLSDDPSKLPMATEARRMTFILIALCQQGEARYTLDTVEHVVKQDDVIIITDRHVVDNFLSSPDLKGLFIMLSVKFFYEMMRNVSDVSSLLLFAKSHPVVSLSVREAGVFANYFSLLKEKMADLSNVIYRVQQGGMGRRQLRADAIFTRFIQLVEENFRKERRVSWYAKQMCITAKYLSETVKQVSKRTPNEWIDSYVTLEVRVLLKNSTKAIKEIALELNFPNQSFLGKFFKEHVGMSPSAYRKKG